MPLNPLLLSLLPAISIKNIDARHGRPRSAQPLLQVTDWQEKTGALRKEQDAGLMEGCD